MAWDTVPAPNYAAFPNDVGNALGGLVSNYQQAQQGQQRTQANDLRNQQDKMLLDQSKAFAGGVPMTPGGTPDWSRIAEIQAEKGNINALGQLAPLIQGQQNLQGANAPDPASDGAGAGGGGSASAPANGGEGGTSKGTYSLSQMITMAEKAGFQGEDAAHIAAVAMAESGGDPGATGSAGEVGLTQINPHAWGFAESARDPQQAFNDAYQVYQKQGWGAWSTDPTSKNFTPGNSMGRYLSQAEADLGKAGGAAGTQVASLGGSDASAYASPEAPAVPSVSAAAGSSIPRANAKTTAIPQQLAANNPAWKGINSALPVGPPGAPAQAPGVGTSAPQAPVPPAQGSVASIASAAGIPPQIAVNIAKAVRVAPGAPLTPEQAEKAKLYIQNYANRTGQQPPQAAQGGPQGGQGQASPGSPPAP
jgi:Lysozyme like domain